MSAGLLERETTREETPKPRYDLSVQKRLIFTEQLLKEQPPATQDRFVCYSFDATDKTSENFANVARTIERIKFEASFGNDAKKMEELYGKYEDQSIFFLAVDQEKGRPAGALRAIQNGPNGFMTINDMAKSRRKARIAESGFSDEIDEAAYIAGFEEGIFQRYNITDANECWDIGTAAVLDEYPGRSPLLFRGMYVASQRKNIKHFFSTIDKKAFNMMQNLGFPFAPLDGATWEPYEGSPDSLAVYGDAPTFEASVREREKQLPDRVLARSAVKDAFDILGRGSQDNQLQF